MKSILRPHQARALEELRAALCKSKRRSPMVQAPTGAGKTVLAAAIIEAALAKGSKVAFTVPRIVLVDQTLAAFWREGIREVGVIQAKHHLTDWSKPCQVCSVDTLASQGYPPAEVVIVDEAHLDKLAVRKWMEACPQTIFIGLSATPWTRGLGRWYDELVQGASVAELIGEGLLSPFKVFAPSSPDLSACDKSGGDWRKADLAKVARSDRAITGDVIDSWLKLGEDRQTICFAVDCAHGRALQERFADAGVSCAYVDAKTPDAERRQIAKDFASKAARIVVNVEVLGMGVDWDVRCIILARPTRSRVRFAQNIGRGLRTAPGKDHLLIIDHSDSHLRLGFITDFADQGLDYGGERGQGARREAERLPAKCRACHALMPASALACPSCGAARPPRQSAVQNARGELAEFTAAERERQRKARKGREQFSAEERARFYAELLGYGRERGFKDGWAANKYREKFHVWPAKRVAPMSPSPEMRSWIQSRNIAWARSKVRDRSAERAETDKLVQEFYDREARQ